MNILAIHATIDSTILSFRMLMTTLLLLTLKSKIDFHTLYLEQVKDVIMINQERYIHNLWINSKDSTILDSAMYSIFENAKKNDKILINTIEYYVHEVTTLILRYE